MPLVEPAPTVVAPAATEQAVEEVELPPPPMPQETQEFGVEEPIEPPVEEPAEKSQKARGW